MTDKDQQLEQLRAAVDRKAEAADESARATQDRSGPPPREVDAPDAAEDAGSPRQKNTRQGDVTADKWNQ